MTEAEGFSEFEVSIGGRTYSTGCLPRTTRCGGIEHVKIWTPEVEACPIVPRDQWITQPSSKPYEWKRINQGKYPACTLASLANYLHMFLARMGRKRTEVDWLKAWRELSGGRGGGVALDAALTYVMKRGFPLLDGSGALAAREAYDLPTMDAFFSAQELGFGAWFGASGHAEFSPSHALRDGAVRGVIEGTWDDDYGDGCWYERSEAYIAAGLPSYGAFCVREWELRPIDLA